MLCFSSIASNFYAISSWLVNSRMDEGRSKPVWVYVGFLSHNILRPHVCSLSAGFLSCLFPYNSDLCWRYLHSFCMSVCIL